MARGGKPAAKKAAKFELTEEQKQEIREAFDLFDTDGSGALHGWVVAAAAAVVAALACGAARCVRAFACAANERTRRRRRCWARAGADADAAGGLRRMLFPARGGGKL